MICVHCEIEFDPVEKMNTAKLTQKPAGKVNECIDCATPGPQRLTGVMIYGHKTAGSIQINNAPRLTEYMLAGSPSAGTRNAMAQRVPTVKDGEGAIFMDKDIAKRR